MLPFSLSTYLETTPTKSYYFSVDIYQLLDSWFGWILLLGFFVVLFAVPFHTIKLLKHPIQWINNNKRKASVVVFSSAAILSLCWIITKKLSLLTGLVNFMAIMILIEVVYRRFKGRRKKGR